MTQTRRTTALVLTTLLLTTSLVAAIPTAMANHNTSITSPGNGAVLQRGVPVMYSATASLGTSPATCSGVSYVWNIGGATLPGQNVAYAFPLSTVPGNKTVTVTATYTGSASHCGNDRSSSITVDVRNVLPSAQLAGPTSGVAGTEVVFDGSGSTDVDGTIASYRFTVDGVAQPAQASPALPLTFTTAGPHVVALSVVDNNGGASGTQTRTITVSAADLAAITVDGPTVLVAGTSGTYALSGADAYGNAVTLSQATLTHTAGTTVGQETVSYTESGVTGSLVVDVVADALDSITVTGPTSLVVGTSATYDLTGADQHGNAVPLAQSTLFVTAPTTAGAFDVTYEESGVTGTLTVDAIAGSLHVITVSGPTEVVVGNAATFALSGADAHGNPVPLATTSLDYVASTWAGTEWICHEEQGVQGCLVITRVPDAPAQLYAYGRAFPVAGTTHDYTLTLYDQHMNTIRTEVVPVTAPTLAGMHTLLFELDGVQTTVDIRVEPDVIANLWIDAPTQVSADDPGMMFARGTDQYGNPVVFYEGNPYHFPSHEVGTYSWSVTEGGLTATHTYEVVAGQLLFIDLVGPESLLANTTGTYAVQGRDYWGNPIAMDPSSIEITAPTAAGPFYYYYVDDGVFTQVAIQVLPDAPALLTFWGTGTYTVGTTVDIPVQLRDQYWNVLREEAFTVDLPTQAGLTSMTFEMDGVQGELTLYLQPDALATLVLDHPATLIANWWTWIDVTGYDQYGNVVGLPYYINWQAPTAAGTYLVEETRDGVTGSIEITVVPDRLLRIVVSGPETLVAGSSGQYTFVGYDQWDNAITLATSEQTVPAPEQVGSIEVCYREQGIRGCLPVAIVPDALASITLNGPTTLVVGTTATYTLSGGDRFGNEVALLQDALVFHAPTTVGTTTVTYEEAGIVGSLVVDLVHGPVASIAVTTSHDAQNLGRTVQSAAYAFDAYGNAIPEAVFSWSATGGNIDAGGLFLATQEGLATLTATYDGVAGAATVLVVTTIGLTLEMSQDVYGQVDAASRVTGGGRATYVDGTPAADLWVVLTFTRGEGVLPEQKMVAKTNADGEYTFNAPLNARLAGTHTVVADVADAPGNSGQAAATYEVAPLPAQQAVAALI